MLWIDKGVGWVIERTREDLQRVVEEEINFSNEPDSTSVSFPSFNSTRRIELRPSDEMAPRERSRETQNVVDDSMERSRTGCERSRRTGSAFEGLDGSS